MEVFVTLVLKGCLCLGGLVTLYLKKYGSGNIDVMSYMIVPQHYRTHDRVNVGALANGAT